MTTETVTPEASPAALQQGEAFVYLRCTNPEGLTTWHPAVVAEVHANGCIDAMTRDGRVPHIPHINAPEPQGAAEGYVYRWMSATDDHAIELPAGHVIQHPSDDTDGEEE